MRFLGAGGIKSFKTGVSDGEAFVSLITRRMYQGTYDFKAVQRLVLRARLHGLNSAVGKGNVSILYGGIDDTRFEVLRGCSPGAKEAFDIDMGLMGKTSYRGFVYAFGGYLHESSEIRFLEVEEKKEFTNDKIR
jgi:hypothetical protein